MNGPHRRYNPLTGEVVLVSPHRTSRPWLGQSEKSEKESKPHYEPECYLCPGNIRANKEINPNYESTYVFVNDFSALLPDSYGEKVNLKNLIKSEPERGICKVVCFSPRHDLSLADLSILEINEVVKTWKNEFEILGSEKYINYVQIFENKGSVMGASNPHPHGQIWAQESIPTEIMKEIVNQKKYFEENNSTLLSDYVKLEIEIDERIIYKNESFVVLVPYWAIWPFETMILPLEPVHSLKQFNSKLIFDFSDVIKIITTKYDKLFGVSFPYSSGIHQAPTDGSYHPEWHFHMHFYPPLLRSATVKKFMVGYEMLANPQRDILPEYATQMLKQIK